MNLLLLVGCGDGRPELVTAVGTVRLDGEPVEGATVMLQPAGREAAYQRASVAFTDREGKFSVGTYGIGDGIPAGKYKVGIQKVKPVGGKLPEDFDSGNPESSRVRMEYVTPKHVADPGSSGLTVEIDSKGMTPSEFDLKRSAAPAGASRTSRAG
jgi:hypothetical protein